MSKVRFLPGALTEIERTQKYEERWEREMREHLMDPPRFDDVLRVVRRNLRQAAMI